MRRVRVKEYATWKPKLLQHWVVKLELGFIKMTEIIMTLLTTLSWPRQEVKGTEGKSESRKIWQWQTLKRHNKTDYTYMYLSVYVGRYIFMRTTFLPCNCTKCFGNGKQTFKTVYVYLVLVFPLFHLLYVFRLD